MTLSDEQIQDLLRVGNPTDEECRLIRMGWDAARARLRTQGEPDGWKLVPIEPTEEMTTAFARVFNVRDQSGTFTPAFRAALAAAPEAKP